MPRDDVFAIRTPLTDAFRPLAASGRWPYAPPVELAAIRREHELREFLCRIFGWDDSARGAVDDAVRTLLAAADRGAAVALRGRSNPVPIAYALHRRLIGPEQPFVTCDPRRRNCPGSVRSPPNRQRGMDAIKAAAGGSVCVSARRLPRDFDAMAESLRGAGAGVQVFICLSGTDRIRDLLSRPIEIPPLSRRVAELDRLVIEYLTDAAQALGIAGARFSGCAPEAIAEGIASFAELEKTLLRLVAVRSTPNVSQAARRLRIAVVSLSRWLRRRRNTPALLNAACLECDDGAEGARDGGAEARTEEPEVPEGERHQRAGAAGRSPAENIGDEHGNESHHVGKGTQGDSRDGRPERDAHRRVRRVRAAAARGDRA